jgi:hypothetical protein
MRVRLKRFKTILTLVGGILWSGHLWAEPSAILNFAQELRCSQDARDCQEFDAIVFIHGIYGGVETFKNATTNFVARSKCLTTV